MPIEYKYKFRHISAAACLNKAQYVCLIFDNFVAKKILANATLKAVHRLWYIGVDYPFNTTLKK